jgi:acetyl esterase/lipase
MALYPEARAAVEAAATETPVWTAGYDIAAARDANREFALREQPEDVAEVVDLDADGVRVRLFRPDGAEPGVLVHLHGGGFVFHDVDVHDRPCRRLANRLGRAVLSVDYRLAPEHRFPAALDDVDTVLAWLDRRGTELGLDGATYVHGDSAGGNLALVAALRHPGRFRAAASSPTRSARPVPSIRARRSGTGSSTPTGTWPTPTSRHSCRTGSAACHPRWSPPPSTTRSATRASTSPR